MAKVDVYGMPGSGPSRIVFMTCNAIGLEYNYKLVDLEKGEHRTPEYLKVLLFNIFCHIQSTYLFRKIWDFVKYGNCLKKTKVDWKIFWSDWLILSVIDCLFIDYNLQLNPQRVIPTVVDGDFILSESRPCATYLVDKYAPDDKLYPKDPQLRARVDQRLYFDMGSLYSNFAQCVVSHLEF